MSAYLIVNIERVKDPEKVQEYGKVVSAHTAKHGGKLIGASPNPAVLEGKVDAVRSLIIEFPDMAALKTWYEAEEYQPMKKIRQEGIDATLWVVDGAEG